MPSALPYCPLRYNRTFITPSIRLFPGPQIAGPKLTGRVRLLSAPSPFPVLQSGAAGPGRLEKLCDGRRGRGFSFLAPAALPLSRLLSGGQGRISPLQRQGYVVVFMLLGTSLGDAYSTLGTHFLVVCRRNSILISATARLLRWGNL